MEIDLHKLFNENMALMIFTVVSLGLLLGRVKIGKIELGSTTGVLLVGLLFGHLGFVASPTLGTFGFTIFIFAVGLQAGPTFFSVFRTDGLKYFILSIVVAVSGVGIVVLLGLVLDLEFGMNAGILAGALTSTPTLVGAQDAIGSMASLPDGLATEKALQNLSVGYAITYIFGTVGLIAFIRYIPVLLKLDLPAEARKLAEEQGFTRKTELSGEAKHLPLIRAYKIPAKFCGRSVAELRAAGENLVPLRIRRNGKIIEAANDVVFEEADVLSLVTSLKVHEDREADIGEEVLDPELLSYDITTKEIVVIKSEFSGKSLKELGIAQNYGCFVRALTRANINLSIEDHVVVNKGDRVSVTGEAGHLDKLAERMGRIESEETETDLFVFSVGILGGIMLGLVMLKLGSVSIGLGSAGGLLLVGILFGYFRSMYPAFGGVPKAARNILMEFGLVLFMAGVGLKAGSGIVEGFMNAGPQLLLAGIVITLVPVSIGYFFGSKVLKMNPAILLGSITGAMTSTPSLNVVTSAAKSEVPALGYAGTYTFANVLLTFAGALLVRLL
ncbi:aspartate:alanine exchanger family transporter [Pontiella sulfatireligans]|uniref:Aspartate/alanine antiporter n=1 Tax=Pontiella sulfatireligans TaxID=2750658 RepID=A0A6C2UPA9_9BACT|nr:TrkA C-terminal domain-containing protein [Pontiella sulfatireligans]VGO21147.1 Aspartate/alanine antiporter [Pontiella sulfatireligans]